MRPRPSRRRCAAAALGACAQPLDGLVHAARHAAHEVARLRQLRGAFDRSLLRGDPLDGGRVHAGGREEALLQVHQLAGYPSAQVAGLVDDGGVEDRSQHAAHLLDVLVAAIADHVEHDDAAALAEAPDQLDQALVGVRVVGVVEQVVDPVDGHPVEASRRLHERRQEREQPAADLVHVHAVGPGRGRRRQRVLHVELREASQRERDVLDARHRHQLVAREHGDVALLAHHRGVALVDVLEDDWVGRAQREEHDVLAAVLRHAHAHRVVGVEHRGAALAHGLGHHGLDLGELVQVADVLQAEVVGLHVEHHADVGGLVAEARAQDAASGRLEHGAVHQRVAQHDLRRVRAAHVALGDEVAAHVDAVGGRDARRCSRRAP